MGDFALLRQMRLERDNFSDPQAVLNITRPLIQSGNISKAGDDSWDIYEQTLIAALEVSDDPLALRCLTILTDKFPQSSRVHALRGMMLEATQDPTEAAKFYEKVLKVEPTNVPIIKRRIVQAKSQGRVGEAIKLLTEYLDTYYTDPDAWAELADLYTDLSLFDKAAFSWSEVILLKPHDHISHASYADSLFAQSLDQTSSHLIYVALKEYLRSIELCDDYVRGFCGVKVCCNVILSSTSENTKASSKSMVRSSGDVVIQEVSIPIEKVRALDLMTVRVLTRLCRDQTVLQTLPESAVGFARSLLTGQHTIVK